MTGFEAYSLYVAIKAHFNSGNDYNFVKFNGKMKNLTPAAYSKRKDKYFFEKIGKKQKRDLLQYIVANMVHYQSSDVWVNDMLSADSEKVYQQWQKRTQSLGYIFKNDLNEIKEFITARGISFDKLFEVIDGEHPIIFRFVQQKMIEIETYIIMNNVLGFGAMFKNKIKESYVFPEAQYQYDRYSEFLNIDKQLYGNMMKEVFLGTK